MEMYQLRQFLAVVTHGSVSRAADAIHISQPAVTKNIRKLETELGAKLLHRVAGGMEPTPVGSLFASHARGILQQSVRALEDVAAATSDGDNRTVLGISSDNVQSYVLPDLLTQWTEHVPRSRLVLDRVSPTELVQKIRQADVDIGFCSIPGNGFGPDVQIEVLLNDRMFVWVRKAHPITRRKRISLTDLARLDWAFFGLGKNPESFIEAHFDAKGFQSPRIAIQSSSISVARDAILNTDLVGILPYHFARDLAEKGALVKIPFQGLEVRERIGLVTSASRPITRPQETLRQIIRDICFREAKAKRKP